MSPHDGLHIVSEGQRNIARDVSACLTFMRTQVGRISAFLAARHRCAQQPQDLHGMNDREL